MFRPAGGPAREPGYQVLTPLRLDSGAFVIVNRGFVPASPQGSGRRAATATSKGRTHVTGLMRQPESRNFFTPADDPADRPIFHPRSGPDRAAFRAGASGALQHRNALMRTPGPAGCGGGGARAPRRFRTIDLSDRRLNLVRSSPSGFLIGVFAVFAPGNKIAIRAIFEAGFDRGRGAFGPAGLLTQYYARPTELLCRRGTRSSPLKYISTRGEAPPLSLTQTLLAGLAPDGGLYLPVRPSPALVAAIASFSDSSYAAVAQGRRSRPMSAARSGGRRCAP